MHAQVAVSEKQKAYCGVRCDCFWCRVGVRCYLPWSSDDVVTVTSQCPVAAWQGINGLLARVCCACVYIRNFLQKIVPTGSVLHFYFCLL